MGEEDAEGGTQPEKEEKVEEVEKVGKGWKGWKATNVGGEGRGKEEAGKRNGQERVGVGGDRCM